MNTERTRHRVLVADDNVDAAETLGMLLRLAGQDVVVVHGGVAAIEQALARRRKYWCWISACRTWTDTRSAGGCVKSR